MKKLLFSTLAVVIITFFTSCKKNDYPPFFKENCKVISHAVSNENPQEADYKINYNYDKNDRISSASTINTFEYGDMEMIITNKYDYIRDKNGRTTSVKFEQTDNQGGGYSNSIAVIYDNKGEKIIKLLEQSEGYTYLEHNLKYNSMGLISEYTTEYLDEENTAYNEKKLFEYNGKGQLTKTTYEDGVGNISIFIVYEPHGIMASNEAYLMEHGLLPINLELSIVYPVVDGGVGSVEKIYFMADLNTNTRMQSKSYSRMSLVKREVGQIGKFWSMSAPKSSTSDISLRQSEMQPILGTTITTESVTLNSHGYPFSLAFGYVYGDGSTNKRTEHYQFDCSGRGRK